MESESGNILNIERKSSNKQGRRNSSTLSDFWVQDKNKDLVIRFDTNDTTAQIAEIDDNNSEDGFRLTNQSRVESIANFTKEQNSKSAKLFHDTDSDEEESKIKTKNETEQIPRGISITKMRSLSIVRNVNVQSQQYIMQGYMLKKSPTLIQCWQKRYFTLTNTDIKYYKTIQDQQAKKPYLGILNFQQLCVDTEFKEISQIIWLKIRGEKRIFQFKCSNQNEFDQWKTKLLDVISKSNGKLNKLDIAKYKQDVNQNVKFWRHFRITEQEFEQKAETGDILLCANVKKDNQVQYKNVFLLFKMEDTLDNSQKGLFVLSTSTSTLDVIMGTWDQFKEYYLDKYTDVCLRQLKIDRDEDFLQQSDDFLNGLRDQPYHEATCNYIKDTESNQKRSFTNIELVFKYMRGLNMIKLFILQLKDERKLAVNCLNQYNSAALSMNKSDFLGEEQYIMITKSKILNTYTDQDQINTIFEEIERQKIANSVTDTEKQKFTQMCNQEGERNETEVNFQMNKSSAITKKDKEEFILGVNK